MRTLAIVALALLAAPFGRAQSTLENRIVNVVGDSELRQLRRNVHPLARAEFDRGKAADSIL